MIPASVSWYCWLILFSSLILELCDRNLLASSNGSPVTGQKASRQTVMLQMMMMQMYHTKP